MRKAKKSLGQNFLKSEIVIRKIIEAGEIKENDVILEIGPGRGALTEKLLATSCQLIAVEKDHNLYELLKSKLKEEISSGQLKLIHDDILKFNIQKARQDVVEKSIAQADEPSIAISQQGNMHGFRDNILPSFKSYKIIANIPYNITGAILKKFLTEKNQPENMILMVQHEVAKKILACDNKESILSISVKAYGEPRMIAKVDKKYFSPTPKVNSAIIAIKNISRKIFKENKINEEKLWKIVKAGFAHKRKKLSNNLKGVCQRDTLTLLGNKRAEDLTLADWISLTKA